MTNGTDVAAAIRATIRRYQTAFSENDRAGWLSLFVDDAVLEDPVGSHRCEGKEGLAEFWDKIHAGGQHSYVVPGTGPAVCGFEAAWSFEVHVDGGDVEYVIPIIDVAKFTEDGRIVHNRAFWEASEVSVVRKS